MMNTKPPCALLSLPTIRSVQKLLNLMFRCNAVNLAISQLKLITKVRCFALLEVFFERYIVFGRLRIRSADRD